MSTEAPAPGERRFLPGIPADHHGNSERILHVDDEPSVTITLHRLLQKLGYSVESFNLPHAAADRFRAAPHDFDLVITDLMMPGMNGIEVARTVQSLRHGLPVVLHSAFTDGHDAASIRRNGICEIIAKPAGLAVIAAALRRALASSSSQA